MYLKNKLNRITLRLTDEQFDFVKIKSEVLGVSPSEFIRMVINAAIVSYASSMNVASKEKK